MAHGRSERMRFVLQQVKTARHSFLTGGFLMSEKSSFTYAPFHNIKAIAEGMPVVQSTCRISHAMSNREEYNPEGDKKMFQQAMDGVKPMIKEGHGGEGSTAIPARVFRISDDECLSQLVELVEHGTGFSVSDTPEYMEGTGYDIPLEFARRLHRGDFSIQAHIDLHGLTASEAKEVFDRFLRQAVATYKRAVLVIHGRGLSSTAEPVLKNKVREWLTSRYWRKWIIAFSSARACDGGAGATYILLRHRSVVKRRGNDRHVRP